MNLDPYDVGVLKKWLIEDIKPPALMERFPINEGNLIPLQKSSGD